MCKLWRSVPFALFLSVLPALAQTNCPNIATQVSKDGAQWRQPVFVSNDAGKPLAGATVTVTDSGHKHSYHADGSGCIGFHAVAGSTYEINATAPGYGTSVQTWEATGASDADTIVDQSVPAAGQSHNLDTDETTAIAGSVAAPGGSPVNAAPAAAPNVPSVSTNSRAAAPASAGPPGQKNTPQPAAAIPVERQTPPRQPQDVETELLEFLLALVAGLAFLILRESTVQVMSASMMKQRSRLAPAFAMADDPAAMTAPGPRPSGQAPQFSQFNADSSITLSEAATKRLNRIRSTERHKLWIIVLALLAHALCTTVGVALNSTPSLESNALRTAAILIDVFAALWALSIFVRRKRILEVAAGIFCSVAILFAIIQFIAGLKPYSVVVPVAVLVLVLGLGWRLLRKAALDDGNHRLVVVRVFKSDKNAAATLGRLASGWRFAGSCFTVADPTWLRYQFAVFSRENAIKSLVDTLTIACGIWLVTHVKALALFLGLDADWTNAIPGRTLVEIVYFLVAVLAILPTVASVSRAFLKEPVEVIAQIERMREARLGVEIDYPGFSVFGYEEAWKPAFDRMLDVAHEVLMDLRGFSAGQQGCAYEIGKLIDRFPLNSALFLIDDAPPVELLRGLIERRWAAMASGSPNAISDRASIKLFAAGEQAGKDKDAIEALLAAAADERLRPAEASSQSPSGGGLLAGAGSRE